MARVCMRPGCDRPADARLSYDTISCQVWLDQMPERLGPVQEICQFHAGRLTVPRGWTLCDRRVEAAAVFIPEPLPIVAAVVAPAEVSSPVSASRRSNRRRHPASTARQLFDTATAQVADAAPAIETVEIIDIGIDIDIDIVEIEIEIEIVAEAEVVAESVDVTEVSEESVGDLEDDDLPESLRATSPLLARAFRATGPQRSVLSHDLAGPRRRAESADREDR